MTFNTTKNEQKKFVILAVSIDSVGHINSCAGALIRMLDHGHRVIFLLKSTFRGLYARKGYEEYIYDEDQVDDENEKKENAGEIWAKISMKFRMIGPGSSMDKLYGFRDLTSSDMRLDMIMQLNHATKLAIIKFQPDLIYLDCLCLLPAVECSKIPYIRNESFTPIFNQFHPDLPPGGSGMKNLKKKFL